jgi:hypothetical protein
MGRYYQGIYKLKNPQKYKGDINNCVYRSSWEYKFYVYCDVNKNIIEFSSEEIVIPYKSPIDNKFHRYFVDFYIKVKQSDNTIKEYLIEIKPKSQTKKVEYTPKKSKKTYINEMKTFTVNSAKWDAAREFCRKKNWEFKIITEEELNV